MTLDEILLKCQENNPIYGPLWLKYSKNYNLKLKDNICKYASFQLFLNKKEEKINLFQYD